MKVNAVLVIIYINEHLVLCSLARAFKTVHSKTLVSCSLLVIERLLRLSYTIWILSIVVYGVLWIYNTLNHSGLDISNDSGNRSVVANAGFRIKQSKSFRITLEALSMEYRITNYLKNKFDDERFSFQWRTSSRKLWK